MNTMKQVLLSVLLMLLPVVASAKEIVLPNSEGVQIAYTFINNETELEVYSEYLKNFYSGNVNIPEKVEYDGSTYKVTSIGRSAFSECNDLTSVSIPPSVTTIGDHAFYGCSGLHVVSIGSGVSIISNNAFSNCSNLSDIFCFAETVPTTDDSAFTGSYLENVTLHVFGTSIDNYKNTAPWSGFKEIAAIGGNTPEKKCAKPTINIAEGKVSFSCETEDVEFVYEITKSGSGKEVDLSNKYQIKVYATKDNYEDSEIATAEVEVKGGGGDLNNDGVINAADVVKLVNIIMDQE